MLSIVVPADSGLAPAASGDPSELAARLRRCPRRSCLFFGEKFAAYILQTCENNAPPPPELYVTISRAANPAAVSGTYAGGADAGETMKVTDMVSAGGNGVPAIWRFSASVSNPLRAAGPIRMVASVENPLSPALGEAHGRARDPHSDIQDTHDIQNTHDIHDISDISDIPDSPPTPAAEGVRTPPENLLEQLNFSVSEHSGPAFAFALGPRAEARTVTDSGKSADRSADGLLGSVSNVAYTHASVPAQAAVLELDTAAPLALKLRSVKPVGRNDIIISTLRIEASEKLAALAPASSQARLVISAVSVAMKGGKVSPVRHDPLPCTLGLGDALSLCYRIGDLEPILVPAPAFPGMSGSPAFPGPPAGPAYSAPSLPTSLPARTPLPDLVKIMEVGVDFRIERKDPLAQSYVTVVEQSTSAQLPLLEMPVNKANLQPRRAATNMVPPKKAVTVNSATSLGHRSPAERPGNMDRFGNVERSSTNPERFGNMSSPLLGKGPKRKPAVSVGTHPAHSSSVSLNITNNQASPLNGLVLTFTGDFSIGVGAVVTWKVQAVNRAGRPLQTSLQVRDLRCTGAGAPRGSHSAVSLCQVSAEDDKSVLPHSQLVHQYLRLRPDKPGVLVLSNDVSLGLLEPNQVCETELQLVGLSKGFYALSGLKLVENSGETVEFGRFLEVVVT